MTDDRIRRLERAAAEGDEEAMAALLQHEKRVGAKKSRPLLRQGACLVASPMTASCGKVRPPLVVSLPFWGMWRTGEELELGEGLCEECDAVVSRLDLESFHRLLCRQATRSRLSGVKVPSEDVLGVRFVERKRRRRS